MKHDPHEMLNGITTRSPGLICVTSEPTSSTMPIGSCPRMSPSSMYGPSTSYRCRSEPQIPLEVTRMIASVGSSIAGSGTVSTRTWWLPCQVTAFMSCAFSVGVLFVGRAGLGHAAVHRGLRAVGQEPARAALELRGERRRDHALLVVHQRLVAVASDVCGVVLVARADLRVEHVGALEELGVGRPRHQRGDRHARVLQLVAERERE